MLAENEQKCNICSKNQFDLTQMHECDGQTDGQSYYWRRIHYVGTENKITYCHFPQHNTTRLM